MGWVAHRIFRASPLMLLQETKMKKIAFITLLAAAGLVQVAHANDAVFSEQPQADRGGVNSIGVPEIQCPEGTFLTPIGTCEPGFDFD